MRNMNNTDNTNEKDSGLALVLIFFLAAYFTQNQAFMIPAGIALVVAMTVPALFKPFAIIWFGLANILGQLSSRIILTLLFGIVVVPVSILKRILSNSDTLQLKKWGQEHTSFKETDHLYVKSDLEKPY